MVTVAEELPFVAAVNDDKLDTVCSNCFSYKNTLNKIDLKKCSKCLTIRYCSKKCQEEDWKFHKDECRFIVKVSSPATKEVRFTSRFIMRVKRGDLPVAFNGRTFDDLMDHKEEINQYGRNENELYSQLISFMGPQNVPTFEEFLSLYGKRVINSFAICYNGIFEVALNIGIALYLGLAVHNHSCRPTAHYHFSGQKIVLRAIDPNAEYSKDLTITYTPLTRSRDYRRALLHDKYYFICDCERCVDEKMELLERSGKSDCCPEDGAVLPVDRKFLWYWQRPLVCTNCGKKADITLEEINKTNELVSVVCATEDIILANTCTKEVVDKLIKLLDLAECYLSPYNFILLELTKLVAKAGKNPTLSSRYRAAEKEASKKYGISKPVENVMRAMITLKEEIIENSKYSREEAFAQFDASCQKALDVVIEIYGAEHSLCKEIEEFSVMAKSNYDMWSKERDEKKTAEGGGDY